MTFRIVNKKQSIYIAIASLLIASFSFLTIHGINIAVSNIPNQPPKLDTINPDGVPNTRPILNNTPLVSNNITTNPEILNSAGSLQAAATPNCQIRGCNHELCVDVNQANTQYPEELSACTNTEANKCYIGGDCRVQAGGKCGWSVNATVNRCLADSNFATQTMRVLQIKFISNPADIPYDPDTLSSELRTYLQDASTFHKYKDPLSKPAINVEIVENITVNHAIPNVENYWYGGYYQLIQDMGLCQKVKDEKIDQVWMWVDPRDASGSPGLEYTISSKFVLKNNTDGSVAKPPFCNGEFTFSMMGFDYTRTSDLALHSFGHYMESLMTTVQNSDLLGKYEGSAIPPYSSRVECGDIHFPPNSPSTTEYTYNTATTTSNYCEDWKPDGTGTLKSMNCTEWGCTQQGYLKWWMQNMPNFNSPLTYQGKKIPSWWDFTVAFDNKIKKYNEDASIYMDNNSYNINNVDLNSNCSCNTNDQFGQPVTLNQCWQNIYGTGATTCWQCVKDTMYQVPMLFCNN